MKMKETPLDSNAPPDSGNVDVAGAGGPQGVAVNLGNGSYFTFDTGGFDCRKMSMERFARTLERFVDRPVVDMTGLASNYDFKLALTPEDGRAMHIRSAITAGVVLPPDVRRMADGAGYESLFSAMEWLGLKLERRKAPLDVWVVDRIEKAPTAN